MIKVINRQLPSKRKNNQILQFNRHKVSTKKNSRQSKDTRPEILRRDYGGAVSLLTQRLAVTRQEGETHTTYTPGNGEQVNAIMMGETNQTPAKGKVADT